MQVTNLNISQCTLMLILVAWFTWFYVLHQQLSVAGVLTNYLVFNAKSIAKVLLGERVI